MAVFSLYFFNSRQFCDSFARCCPPNLSTSNCNGNAGLKSVRGRRTRRSSRSSFAVLSTHSNPRILKPNRKSPSGRILSTFDDSDEDEEDDFSDDDDDDEEEELPDEDEEDEEDDDDLQSSYLCKNTKHKQGKGRRSKQVWEETSSVYGESMKKGDRRVGVKRGRTTPDKRRLGDSFHSSNKVQGVDPVDMKKRGKLQMKTGKSIESRFRQLSEELDLDEKWLPLLDYLSTFDLKESHFIQMYERHMPSLQINVASAQERLEFLLSVGVKHKDIRKILMRQPQILGYSLENNIKSHIAFLVDLGVPQSRLGHIITAAPSLLSYSVEQSLKPTVRFLVEEVGIKSSDLSKVVQLSPQILVQRIDNSWNTRFNFLSQELGAPKDSIVKMVKKHPQLLHYSIEDGILPRINFLRSIGMRNSEIVKVLTSLTQVLSLSLEGNLKPKYLYLVNELGNEVKSLTKYPTYLSLSLDQRIRPRHRFLVSLKKAPKGPFPLSSFVPTDESFCQQWAGTSVDKYLAFRQTFLLKELANKYGRKR